MQKISVICASYNYEKYIKETIESVLAQDFQNWEMIIVDDGSKDNSLEVIEAYCKKDERIKLFTHPNHENRGLDETIKLALKNAQGEWVAFLESDDTFTKDKLSKNIEIIKTQKDVDFIFTAVQPFGDNAVEKKAKYFKIQKKYVDKKQYPLKFIDSFMIANMIPTFSCVMCKKELFNDTDFNSPIKACLDYWLWTQLAGRCNVYYCDEKLTNWRIHNSYLTTVNRINELEYEFKKSIFKNISKYSNNPINKLRLLALNIYYKRKNIISFSLKEKKLTLFNHNILSFNKRDKKEDKTV